MDIRDALQLATLIVSIWILFLQRNFQRSETTFKFIAPWKADKVKDLIDWVLIGDKLTDEYITTKLNTAHLSEDDNRADDLTTLERNRNDFKKWVQDFKQHSAWAENVWDKQYGGNLADRMMELLQAYNDISRFSETDWQAMNAYLDSEGQGEWLEVLDNIPNIVNSLIEEGTHYIETIYKDG